MGKNSPFWLDGKATIVVLPSGDEGKALFALAENWSEVGLLGPALWVEPSRVATPEGEPVLVKAVVLGNDRAGNHVQIVVDLFEQLAKENLSTIRLIQVRSVSRNGEFDEIQNQVARQVEDAVYLAIPSGDTRNNRKSHLGLHVISLIAAPSAHTVEQRLQDVLSHGGGATVVASPEDRSSPWSTDAFVRNGKKFVGFVLMHLATTGGLWKGLPIGTLELFEREGSARESVFLSRVFVSSVLTDGLARRVSAQVLQDTIDPHVKHTTAPAGSAYIEDKVKDEYVTSMVNYLMALDDAVMDYHPPAELQDPEKMNVGISAALRSFATFAWTKSIRIPYWAYRFVRNKFAVNVQKRLQGKDGYADVERELREEPLDMRDRTILTRQGMLEERERSARKANAAPVRLSEIRSTPYLWSSIREMIFGSLDGGADLSEKGFPRVDTTLRPIFRSPDDLFPSPAAVFELTQRASFPQAMPTTIDWENYGNAHSMGQELDKWWKEADLDVDRINGELGEFAQEISDIDKRLDTLEEELRTRGGFVDLENGDMKIISIADAKALDKKRSGPPPLADSDPDANDEIVTGSASAGGESAIPPAIEQEDAPTIESMVREYKTLSSRRANVEKAVPEGEKASLLAQDEVALRQEVLEEYRQWQSTTDRSLLWKLRQRMDRAMKQGTTDLRSFQDGLEAIEPHITGTLAALREKFHRSLLITHSILFLVAGIAASIGWGMWANEDLKALGAKILFWTAIATPAILLISMLLLFIPYHRKWAAFERSVEIQLTNLERIETGTSVCRSEIQRLTAIHAQAIHWLKILATVTHTPWEVRPSWLESGLKTLDLDSMPYAMKVAQAHEGDRASFTTLLDSAQTKLEQPGWRKQAFDRLVEAIQDSTGRSGKAFSLEALDQDLPHATNNSRNHLEKYMEDSGILQTVAAQYLKPLIEELQGKAMANARPEVVQAEDDPLQEFRGDIEGIEDYSNRQKWDEFLSHTLTLNSGDIDPVTALSVLSISPENVMEGEHENVSSYALIPEHVYSKLDPAVSTGLTTQTYDSKVARPLDSVIRVDIVGPVNLRSLRVVSGTRAAAQKDSDGDSENSGVAAGAFPKKASPSASKR